MVLSIFQKKDEVDTMKEIPLTQGKVALVDDEDYEWLNQWKWCVAKAKHLYYAVRRPHVGESGTILHMHRAILGLKCKDGILLDHKDRNGLNNQKENLRIADRRINSINSKLLRSTNTSGFRGVTWSKKAHKWQASINTRGINIWGGYHHDPIAAARAHDKMAKSHYGDIAKLNFPAE